MEDNYKSNIVVTSSPHVRNPLTTTQVMWNVVIALLPALVCAVIFFGWQALGVALWTIIGAVATEAFCDKVMFKRPLAITDGSAVLTGMLLGMTLPAGLPWWIALVGGIFAIGVGKMAFGGLGQNIFNPALVGRVFLLISFPAQMTTWPELAVGGADGMTGATYLSGNIADPDMLDYFLGVRGGSLGEVGALALLVGAAYLWLRKIITLWIPCSIIVAMAVLAVCTGSNIGLELLSGGLVIGAFFMATDYVTSPMTPKGQIVYGAMIGIITFVIRHYGAYPEGISFAILLMNGCTPLINRWMKPRLFGERSVAK